MNSALWLPLDQAILGRIEKIKNIYKQLYSPILEPEYAYICSPGRAEILGNHTDYNEGYTLSANIVNTILIAGCKRTDKLVKVVSLNQQENIVTFSIESEEDIFKQKLPLGHSDYWSNYVKAVVWSFIKSNIPVCGFNAVVESTIPMGGGVSSSAALELAIAQLISQLTGNLLAKEIYISLCKEAENKYVGAPCGYLDQATIALADNSWLFIDYRPIEERSFTWKTVQMDIESLKYKLVIGYDPESKHTLVDGKYTARKKVCEGSIPVISRLLDKKINALRDVSSQEYEQIKNLLQKDLGERAARWLGHIIYEDERVLEAMVALQNKDIVRLGQLMTASGKSAIYEYELAEDAPELAWIYERVMENSNKWGIAGIRNMGGGFNATTLALVQTNNVEGFKKELNNLYLQKFIREYHFLEFIPAPAVSSLDYPSITKNIEKIV